MSGICLVYAGHDDLTNKVIIRAGLLSCLLLLSFAILVNAAPKLEVIHSGERKWALLLADLEQASSSICLE